jgi:hypothetical protein
MRWIKNAGVTAAHPTPTYRCFLPDLTGFSVVALRGLRQDEATLLLVECAIPYFITYKNPFMLAASLELRSLSL